MATAEYQRNWRKRNAERSRELSRLSYARHREKRREEKRVLWPAIKDRVKAYNEATKEQRQQNRKSYHLKHKERLNAQGREWVSKNKERHRKNERAWSKSERGLVLGRAKVKRRRASKLNATVPLTPVEERWMQGLYAQAEQASVVLDEPHVVDHIVPLARGGKHHPANMRVITSMDNSRKKDRLDHEVRCPILRARLIVADPTLQ